MSNPDPEDEQFVAEAIDEGVLDADDVGSVNRDPEDTVRASFPPDRQQGIDVARPGEVPEEPPPPDEPVTGLVETDDDPDEEVAELGDQEPLPPAEEAAVHEAPPPPDRERDSYLDE